ncbi:MAG: ATP synthase F1 subunit delta [Acidobacteriota bacterium]
MAKINDEDIAVARVYSRALLALAEEGGKAEEALEELAWLAEYASSDESFRHFVSSPMVDEEARASSIEKMFRGRLSDLLVDTLQVVNAKGRLSLLPAIAETYRQDHQDLRGHVDVQVATAVPLTDEIRARVVETVERFSGRQPALQEVVDPSLIGGIVLRVGDKKIDASVKNEVNKYRKLLLDLADREILGTREDALIED